MRYARLLVRPLPHAHLPFALPAQASRRPGRLPGATAPYPDPDALTAILDDAAQVRQQDARKE